MRRIASAAAARTSSLVRSAVRVVLRKELRGVTDARVALALKKAIAAVDALPVVTGVNVDL